MGVIGLGFFGSRHASIWRDAHETELVAVCDLDQHIGQRIAAELGAVFEADPFALLARRDIDAVSLCLPDRDHETLAVAGAAAGKHMLLEKPLAHTTDAAVRIVQAAEAASVRLMIGHILRFDPRYVAVHQASEPELIGGPLHLLAKRNGVRGTARRLGSRTSILFYMGVHDVDALQWVARSPITRVYAQKVERLETGNEDALYAVLNFENGAIGLLDYSWAWPNGLMNGYKAVLEVVGTRGAAFLDVHDQGFYAVSDAAVTGGDTHLWPEVNGRIVGDLADELRHFATAVLSGRPFVQHHREALAAIPVLDALAHSAVSGLPVEVRRPTL